MDSTGMFLQLKVRLMVVRELTSGSGIFFGLLRIPREGYRKDFTLPAFRMARSSRYRLPFVKLRELEP